ncbi:MAG TPA: hypothetical protein VK890_04300 [Bacteroidia bacterium]|nr:hypothetical protein [Bacteroidia bacterium]
MKYSVLVILAILFFPKNTFSQERKIEVTKSPNATVIVGNGNTVNKVTVRASLSITHSPTSAVVELGNRCLFTVKAGGGVKPYGYTWFINGQAVRFGTADSLEIERVRLDQNNAQIAVLITDAKHMHVTSEVVTLRITQRYWIGYSVKDPYINDTAIPSMEKTYMNLLFHDSSIVFQLPKDAEGAFWVIKVPVTEPAKNAWYHNDVNYGDIPDIVIRKPFTLSNFTYYISRSSFFFNYRLPIILQQ